jgi:phosphohistidine phosphatase
MTIDSEPRRLVLLRHGKSAYPQGVPDHERPLAERGERQARLAGEWIRATLPPIDRVLCSTATRTRQTLAATGIDAPTTFTDAIYGAYPDELLELVRELPDGEHVVLLIGHAPGLPDLAEDLAGPGSNKEALAQVRTKFPTSAIAVVAVRGAWSAVDQASTSLTHCVIPR